MAIDLEGFDNLTDAPVAPDQTIVERLRFDDALEVPHQLTDLDVWANYVNNDLYDLDVAVRAFIKKTRYTRLTKGKPMKTAVPMVFLAIFGRKATPADSQVCVMLHRLLKYYATRTTGANKISGVRFSHVYYFSKYAMSGKRPYSLRLRLEEQNNESSLRGLSSNTN